LDLKPGRSMAATTGNDRSRHVVHEFNYHIRVVVASWIPRKVPIASVRRVPPSSGRWDSPLSCLSSGFKKRKRVFKSIENECDNDELKIECVNRKELCSNVASGVVQIA
jgi:hypothetical protein